METLGKCCSCSGKGQNSVTDVLSTIKGPWAIIYWQVKIVVVLVFSIFCFCLLA